MHSRHEAGTEPSYGSVDYNHGHWFKHDYDAPCRHNYKSLFDQPVCSVFSGDGSEHDADQPLQYRQSAAWQEI